MSLQNFSFFSFLYPGQMKMVYLVMRVVEAHLAEFEAVPLGWLNLLFDPASLQFHGDAEEVDRR